MMQLRFNFSEVSVFFKFLTKVEMFLCFVLIFVDIPVRIGRADHSDYICYPLLFKIIYDLPTTSYHFWICHIIAIKIFCASLLSVWFCSAKTVSLLYCVNTKLGVDSAAPLACLVQCSQLSQILPCRVELV